MSAFDRLTTQLHEFQARYPGAGRIVENLGWLFADNMLRLLSVMIINAWVVRYLGPQQYGTLSFALAFVALFTPLALLGLPNLVMRDLVEKPQDENATLGTAFALMLGGAAVGMALAAVGIVLLRPHQPETQRLAWLIACGLIFQAFTVIEQWFNAQVRAKYVVYARNAALLVASAGRVGAVLAGASLLVFAAITVIESGLFALGLLIVFQRTRGSLFAWRVRLTRAQKLLADGWPLLLESLAVMIYMRIDQTMLGQMISGEKGAREVGLYAAAVKLSEIWLFVPMAIRTTFFPTIVRSKKLSPAEYRQRIQRLLNLMVLLSYGVAIPTTILAPFIIRFFYGPEFSDAAPMLAILIWAGVWTSMSILRSAVVQSENRQVLTLQASILGAVSNVLLNLILIPPLGGIGSAIATNVSYGIQAYISSLLFPALTVFGKMQTRALIYPNPFGAMNSDKH
ncbi:MAG: flippase [Aggregatilineaceae bacterium]